MKSILKLILICLCFMPLLGQNSTSYWQQKVDYSIEIDVDVSKYQYQGSQQLIYSNNSPDTLRRVFYHLYFNAFQPGSEMDVRSRTIIDPDRRIGERISKLSPSEIGYIRPLSLRQDGKDVEFKVVGTVLEVVLNNPILPNQQTIFNMEWEAQIPVQIRRSGRNNEEGIALSMAQWFPKIAEYDFEGWHADPYIMREFYSVWGDYDVKITLDANYTVGGTGILQNPSEVGHGYQLPGQKTAKPKKGKYTWHFKAENVHDFTWAADPEYLHDIVIGPNEVELHFLYKNKPEIIENWKNLQPIAVRLMEYYNNNIGPYPYKQYSIIQAGDGGMEYGMCTLVLGEGTLEGLLGTVAHEIAHSWFQFILANNELRHPWLDEGFSDYIDQEAINFVMNRGSENPHLGAYMAYFNMVKSGKEQPQSTQADRYETKKGSGVGSYSKGTVFLSQLAYIIGEENLKKTLKRYYKEWKFKHPAPNDFIRIAEKVSGFELEWYLLDWTQTTNTIDYGIKAVEEEGEASTITLERIGLMPMPIDLAILFEDGSIETYYIPLRMARGVKPNPYPELQRTVLNDWAWAYPSYEFTINNGKKIMQISIDPSLRMADIQLENNTYVMK